MRQKIHKIKNLHKTHKYHVIAAAVILALVAVVFAQLMYPYDKMMPLTKIGGVYVGGWHADDVVEELHRHYGSVPLTLDIEGQKSIETTSVKAGITPKYKNAVEQAHGYSMQERFIPFSFVYKTIKQADVPLNYTIDDQILDGFMQQVTKHCNEEPKDAGLKLSGESVALDTAKPGRKCEKQEVKSALQDQKLSENGMTASIEPAVVQPARTNEEVQAQLQKAEDIIAGGLTIASADEQWEIPKETIVSWLQVDEMEENQLAVSVDNEKIKQFLRELRSSLHKDPEQTRIIMRDGVEIDRQEGKRGQGIDVEVTTERVRTTLLEGPSDTTAWVKLSVLEPEVVYERHYTSTNAGLQALLEQWDRNNPGRYGIIVQDLSGKDVSAALNPTRDFVPASTYKMFLAYTVLHQVESGDITMETKTDNGMSVKSCIDEMIINSTNFCATALFNLVGRRNVHDFIQSQGFVDTTLDNSMSSDGEKHTTARDETDFLIRLNQGSLLNDDNTGYLLGLMKRQIYKSGIPKGVAGAPVANKVGFYEGYKHDVGIIYAQRGTYILTILSHGGSDEKFADLSRRVADLMK